MGKLLENTEFTVRPEWIDYNGHMNVAYYVLAFDQAADKMCELFDLSVDYVKRTNNSIFVAEMHVTYVQELKLGDPIRLTFQLLDCDDKRFHYFLNMYHGSENYLAATSEQMALHVDLTTRRTAPFPATQRDALAAVMAEHRGMPRPPQAGSIIGIRRKVAV